MTAVLNWIKANWLIVLFAVLMLVSLPAFFFVGESMKSKNREAIASRIQDQERRLSQVETVNVEIQPLVPGSETFSERLPITQNVVNQFREIREIIKQDADSIESHALAINDRSDDLLVAGLFPDLPPEAVALKFRIYDAAVDAHELMLFQIDAGSPPPPREVYLQVAEFERTYRRSQLNAEPGQTLTASETEKLEKAKTEARMQMYEQAAADLGVYASIDVFNLDEWSSSQGEPSSERMWDWQHTKWLHEDIINAVRKANTGTDGELLSVIARGGRPGAVVKRIESIMAEPIAQRRRAAAASDFGEGGRGEVLMGRGGPMTRGGQRLPSRGGGGGGAAPATPSNLDDPTQMISSDFSASVTGRVSNALFDVRNVTMTAIVDSTRIPVLMDAISSTNFMSVTGSRIEQVDPYMDLQEGYLYGNDPVVRLTLDIETLWLRSWTTELMPYDVQVMLGIIVPEPEEDEEDEFEYDPGIPIG
ncbi:MAG: hypothetical protein ACOC0P_00015 [Planctomycetota bacterium]